MRRLLLPLLAVLAVLAGCGGDTHTASVPVPLQARCMGAPSPFAGSACHPEGFSPAPAPKTRTLTGSSIHIDGPGLHLIEQFEGYTRCAFFDTFGGVWTVGFGQTRGVHQGTCFPVHSGDNGVAAATANLKSSVESEYQWAVRGLGVSFNQNQVDALDSFAYNLGAGIFTGSLRTSIQHHNPFPMLAFDHAGGVVLSGLSRRRHEEVALFLKPAHEETPAARAARVRRERTARLHADYRARRALDRTLARFHCLHGYRGFSHDHARKCTMWRAKHGAINRDIKRLRAAGIR